ncbi:MAG TPA: EthD family reductase [Saprospiraceae bacterium]|nr:EthD family reductase [Saprospiraceae bacterium]
MKHYQIFIYLFCLSFLSCKTNQLLHTSTPGNELYKVSILYPNGEGKTFDMNYYVDKHMPMVARCIGKNLSFYEIDRGISGRTVNDPVPYLAIGSFYVKDIAEYNKAIGQYRDAIISDFKNYTNIQPVVQISEVRYVGLVKE